MVARGRIASLADPATLRVLFAPGSSLAGRGHLRTASDPGFEAAKRSSRGLLLCAARIIPGGLFISKQTPARPRIKSRGRAAGAGNTERLNYLTPSDCRVTDITSACTPPVPAPGCAAECVCKKSRM